MALKASVYEKCERCGQRAARKVGNYVTRLPHKCPGAPPGPGGAPQRFNAAEVIFVSGEFSAETYRAELDEAWTIIVDLRNKRHLAETAVKAAIETAMRQVYNPTN